MNVLYEIAMDDRAPIELRYEAARKLQQSRPKPIEVVVIPVKRPRKKKTKPTAADLIRQEIGDNKFNYIVNHYGKQSRSVTSKITGIPKYKLNAYYHLLYGAKEAGA